MPDRVDDVRQRLEGLAEELADLALDRLRQAVDEEDPVRAVAEERRITRARRAVERAAGLLDERGSAEE
ncbi:MAG: hypothetical protein ACT4PX_11410 [Actinomycetota bacterium]